MVWLGAHSTNRAYVIIMEKWRMLLDMKQPVDCLILGDSSGNQGVDPQRLKTATGMSAVNLCTVGDMQVLNDVWMLQHYLAHVGTPRVVILVHTYDGWPFEMAPQLLAKTPLSVSEILRFRPKAPFGVRGALRFFFLRYFPLYSDNLTLSSQIKHPWKTFEQFHQAWTRTDGFTVLHEANIEEVRADAADHQAFVRKHPAVVSEENTRVLKLLRELADEHHFDVFVVNSPIYEGLYKDEVFQAFYRQLTIRITRVLNGDRWIHNLLPDPKTFPADQMENADHVTYAAAQIYTDWLVSRLATSGLPLSRSPGDKRGLSR